MTGVARMIQLDGGEAVVTLPYGVRLSGAGVPGRSGSRRAAACRAGTRVAGDPAYGGRAAFFYAIPGYLRGAARPAPRRTSWRTTATPVRQEVGADFRLQPLAKNLTVFGFGAFSLYDERFSEGEPGGELTALPRLHVTADWRYTAPDLFLARNSILSVFSGGGAQRRRRRRAVRARARSTSASTTTSSSSRTTGTTSSPRRGRRVGAWRHERGRRDLLPGQPRERLRRRASVRASGLRPVLRDGGRARARLRGGSERRGLLHLRHALGGSRSARLQRRRCGARRRDPFLEQTYDVMAKLVYNQTYRIREVR